jgi:hypothetical protein
LRTGPLGRRGAKVSRAIQANSTTLRTSEPAALFGRRLSNPFPLAHKLFKSENIFKSSRIHLECRLPINLREFLASHLGAVVDESDETVLRLAATADETTLSQLARAIRRYSTTRAQQAWQETSIPLARLLLEPGITRPRLVLCLKCARVDFDDAAAGRHLSSLGCISLAFDTVCETRTAEQPGQQEVRVADAIRRLIEEFRAVRAVFGLPHFELDSFVRHCQVTFTWRPLA